MESLSAYRQLCFEQGKKVDLLVTIREMKCRCTGIVFHISRVVATPRLLEPRGPKSFFRARKNTYAVLEIERKLYPLWTAEWNRIRYGKLTFY